MTSSPKVLVSVLHYRDAEHTIETLAAFQKQTYPNFTLQVIDNASPDTSLEEIRHRFPDVNAVRLENNGGYTAGNNHALDQGLRDGFDYVLISNHDVLIEPDLVANLVETAQEQPDCGVVGAIEEDSRTGEIRAVGGAGFTFWKGRGHWIRTLQDRPAASSIEVDYVQGALILFSRRALEKGIRLDEKLFMYGEEIDLSFQLKQQKLLAFTDLRCRVRHKSPEGTLSPFQGYYLQRNRLYLCRKHGSRISYVTAIFYTLFAELPVKTVVRILQRHPRFVLACWNGFRDSLRGTMFQSERYR